jgi:hypothetical protein
MISANFYQIPAFLLKILAESPTILGRIVVDRVKQEVLDEHSSAYLAAERP